MKRGFASGLIVVGCFAMVAVALHAQTFYKWKDAGGTTHYTSTPPPKIDATKVKVKGEAGAVTGPAPVQAAAPSAETKAASSPELQEAEVRYRKESCQAAQRDVTAVQSGAMLVDSSNPSQAKRLDESQRQDALAAAQDRVKQFCGGGGGNP